MTFDAFISYSSKDKTAANAACAVLEGAGVRCWIAPRDIRPGVEYGAAIIDAMDQCRVMVLIFSSSANDSVQIRREIERAVSKAVPIVPVRIEEVAPTKSMEYFLGAIHWLDALTPPIERHLPHLAETVKAILQVDPSARGAPANDALQRSSAPSPGGDAVPPPARTVPSVKSDAASHEEAPLAHRPTIAVLPFDNLSGDPQQDYFSDGIVEEIITALTRTSWLFVIARNSSFIYKGRAVDVKQVGRELGVHYVLEGSLRKSANRVRITCQLIDATNGMHIWADRYDGALEDIFDLQDQVTANLVSAIAPQLQRAAVERARRKPTENLSSYDYFLRGMANSHQWNAEASNDALRHFHKAITLDPEFATAYGMAAWCYVWRIAYGWIIDAEQEYADAVRLARRAIELGPDDAVALGCGGYVLGFVGRELEAGATFVDRARALNPSHAPTWYFSGWLSVFLGEPEAAIPHFAQVMRLSPRDPLIFHMQNGTAWAHFFAGRCDEALSWAERALRESPNCKPALRISAASQALLGRMEDARKDHRPHVSDRSRVPRPRY